MKSIRPAVTRKRNVFVTGGTGFVGVHLVKELAARADVGKIYLLYRGRDGQPPITSMTTAQERYCLADDGATERLRMMHGDIAAARLGLCDADYDAVVGDVDVIYHVAARVNHVLPYRVLKPANVDSAAELMKIAAAAGRPKVLNFVSTMGAATRRSPADQYTETFPGDTPLDSDMGYLQSKWAAERLLSKFVAAGFAANIFRLGYVAGHRRTGVSLSADNQLMLLIKSCIQSGYAPVLPRLINLTPVDAVAELMAAGEFRKRGGEVVNVVNTTEYITWEEIIDRLNDTGYSIEMLDFKYWQTMLRDISPGNALYKFLPLYSRPDADEKVLRFGKDIEDVRTENMSRIVRKYGIELPKVKYDLLDRYFDYLRRIEFIPGSPVGAVR